MCVFYDISFMIPNIQFGTLGGNAQTSMYKNFHFIFVPISFINGVWSRLLV